MRIRPKTIAGLTGNQLKLLALIAMTCDHVGLQLLPQFIILRIIGRLAAPLFAYMIAEGCRYTHNRGGIWVGSWAWPRCARSPILPPCAHSTSAFS